MTTYPNSPGFKTAGPSQESALAEIGRAAFLRENVLQTFQVQHELTADEAANLLNESVLAIRPRFSELLKQGKIEDSGKRRKNVSGKNATVWRVVVTRKQQEFAL